MIGDRESEIDLEVEAEAQLSNATCDVGCAICCSLRTVSENRPIVFCRLRKYGQTITLEVLLQLVSVSQSCWTCCRWRLGQQHGKAALRCGTAQK